MPVNLGDHARPGLRYSCTFSYTPGKAFTQVTYPDAVAGLVQLRNLLFGPPIVVIRSFGVLWIVDGYGSLSAEAKHATV